MPHRFVGVLVVVFAVVACGSEAEVGESCEDRGKTDVCVDGAVCSQTRGGALQCLKICTEQGQCAATESCNGVEGSSLKACRVEK